MSRPDSRDLPQAIHPQRRRRRRRDDDDDDDDDEMRGVVAVLIKLTFHVS